MKQACEGFGPMQIFTVHEPREAANGPPATLDERADGLVFVKDGFSLRAFVLGPLWLVMNRLWLPLAAWIAAFLAIQVVFWLLPASSAALGPVLLIAALGFALEASSIRRWGLERRGYRTIGTVAGQSHEDCEHRFLTSWLGSGAASRTPPRSGAP